ncbi:MAG: GGDEF domain-containing protein [Candidatus Brocadiia bacterium]
MSKKYAFRLRELHSLHANLRFVLVLMLLLTLSLLTYMAVRVFLLRDVKLLDFFSLCFFAVACLVLCVGQLQCLRRMRHDTREKIEMMTFVDELTGVYNYRYLEQRLTEELQRAKRHGCPLAVIYMDFDNFKLVNDTFGHETGNTVLQRVSQVARASARGEDFVGRLGGDEFLVVLPQTDAAGALITAERIKKKLDSLELVASNGERIDFITFSMGVASYPADAESREDLLRAADEAMYRAKKAGGDRVCI